jgi:hypothetical protein
MDLKEQIVLEYLEQGCKRRMLGKIFNRHFAFNWSFGNTDELDTLFLSQL